MVFSEPLGLLFLTFTKFYLCQRWGMAKHVEKSTMVLHEDVNENGLTTTLTNLELGLNFVI